MKNSRRLFVLLVVLVATDLLAGVAYVLINKKSTEVESSSAINRPVSHTDQAYGFKINYDKKWVVDTTDRNLQLHLTHPTGCTLSYGQIDTRRSSEKYVKFGVFDETTKTFFEKEDHEIYIGDGRFIMTHFQERPQDGGTTKIIGIYINDFPKKDAGNLLLYANGAALSEDCVSDFLALVDGVSNFPATFYRLYTIDSHTTGTLESATSNLSIGYDQSHWTHVKTALIFKDQQGNEHVLAYLPVQSSSYPPMQLVGSELFFVNATGLLSSIDLVSKRVAPMILPGMQTVQKNDPPPVNDFFIYGDNLYYLSGKNCNEYLAPCNLALHQDDRTSGQEKILAKGVTSQSIMGYDPSAKMLYLEWSTGDAGCSSQKIQGYDFRTDKLTDVVQVGHCEGDSTAATPEDQKVKTIENDLMGQLGGLDKIAIVNGEISKSQTKSVQKYGGIRYVENQ